MKDKKLPILLLSAFSLFSCTGISPEREVVQDNSVETVRFKLTQYGGDEMPTRTTYSTAGAGQFLWAEGDVVGIVSSEGNQMKFPIKEEYYGQDYALFDGRGFALVPNSSYSSYYPFQPDYDINPSAVPIFYEGQQQTGDNNLDHLGGYSYSVATGQAPEGSRLDFEFLNMGSPHRYRMPVLAGEYTLFTLSASADKYITRGTFNMMDENDIIAISPTETKSSISLSLSGTTMNEGDQLRCWMMLPPVDFTGETIHMTLKMSDGNEIIASVEGKDCPANTRRVFNALTSVYPAKIIINNEGSAVEVKVIKSAATDDVTISNMSSWITLASSSSSGQVTTYTFDVAENPGAERTGTVSFTETATGLVNTVSITQQKAGTIIGVGGWATENHSGRAN